MLIYYENKIANHPLTKQIFENFKNCEKIPLQHYKNLFDLKVWNYNTEPFLILAKQDNIAILPTPPNYGFPGKSFFFKPSINCFFRCKYCYLQWTFRNRFPVFFLNYEDMQQAILNKIKETRDKWFEWQITFYASNYADLLATEDISHFHSEFLPFCEQLQENVIMETRTKSNNISSLIKYAENLKTQNKQPSQNLEIAFSLSPRDIATEYEIWTATLDQKIEAINTLLKYNFRVGLRFLPLLPVNNFKAIYSDFLKEISWRIDINKISSIALAPLIFNEWDYTTLLKKQSDFSILSNLVKNEHNLRTLTETEIQTFKDIFSKVFTWKKLLRDYK